MNKYIVEVPDGCIPKQVHCDSNSGFTVSVSARNCEAYAPEENQAIKEMTLMAEEVTQQPAVPIQFVWIDGSLMSVDDGGWHIQCDHGEVEQIGAVLYVRGE